MDNLVSSTQQFDVQEYDDNDQNATSSFAMPAADDGQGHNFTQAFAVPETSVIYGQDDEYEDEESAQQTQAFGLDGVATQAFSIGTLDDTPPIDDPMLSTQNFSVAEYTVVSDAASNVANTSGASDYGLPSESDNPHFVGGLEVVDNAADAEYNYDGHEVAVEEVVEGDELPLEEIASPDPEELEEDEEQDDEEVEHIPETRRVNRIASSDDDEEQQEIVKESPVKRSKIIVEDDDDDDGANARVGDEDAGSDADPDAEKKSEVGELIADIFGDSDDEPAASDAEEQEDQEGTSAQQAHAAASDSETKDSDDGRGKLVVDSDSTFVSDFDLMMERRKAENRRRYRKRKDYDIVNDSDDVINELITQMKHAAKADIDLNKTQKPALTKRKLLPTVVKQLKKSDLQSAFIELGVVTVIADWLCPLPDGSLPALEIRTELLKVLQQFPTLDHQILKSSSIGKAIMILYKHPKEVKENKERAGKLINEWARPIFSLQSDYRSLSKEERVQRDYEHMPLAKKRRMSSMDSENKPKETKEEEKQLRPGDKGWIGRARVPQPSTKDYVVRPKWNIESEARHISSKRGMSMMDRKIREIKERTKPKKAQRAVGVSIEGKKMMF